MNNNAVQAMSERRFRGCHNAVVATPEAAFLFFMHFDTWSCIFKPLVNDKKLYSMFFSVFFLR